MSIQLTSLNNNVFQQTYHNNQAIKPKQSSSELVNDSVELSNKKTNNNTLAFLGLTGIFKTAIDKILVKKKDEMPAEDFSKGASDVDKSIQNIPNEDNNADDVQREFNDIIQDTQKKVDESAQSVQKEASEIYRKMEETLQEVIDLYYQIKQGNHSENVELDGFCLKEFDEDGNITRRSVYSINIVEGYEQIMQTITEYNGKTKNVLVFKNGKPIAYKKGIDQTSNTVDKVELILVFQEDGKLLHYIKDSSESEDLDIKTELDLKFKNGKLTNYQKGCEISCDDCIKTELELELEDGKIVRYNQDFEKSDNGTSKSALGLELIDGKWQKINNK